MKNLPVPRVVEKAALALTNSTRARTPRPRTCRGLTRHFHILMYLSRSRRRRARSPARRGGLTADARYLPHLSPPPYQEPDGTPKQNGQQRTCHECSPPIGSTKGRGAARGLFPIIQHLTHAPKTERLLIYDYDGQRNTRPATDCFLNP